MAKLNSVHQLLFLALIFSMTKVQVTDSQGTFDVYLYTYYEKANDLGGKCIKLCVTTSPSGFPRCNLNITKQSKGKGIATVSGIKPTKMVTSQISPDEYHTFQFTEWKNNSELSATVWKLPSGQSCDVTSPTNSTNHGEGGIIIPRLKSSETHYIEVAGKWKLKVTLMLKCDNPGCLPPCVPRDNSTGHYTCHDGNKQCLSNWFGEKCTIFCNKTSSTYKCRKNGSRICNPNQFGRDCDVFCDKNATSYMCDKDGRRMCLPNWFNQNCDQFCDSSEGNYVCDGEGHPLCLLHWYGEKCTKYCNNSATHYKCNDKGDRVCLRDWYGPNCSKFCNNSNKQFKCNVDGDKICLKNWFGKDCSKFCNNSDAHYKCNDKGDRVCLRDWYGPNCSKFCDNSNKQFKCNVDGDKICLKNWFGKDCSKFCNNSATHYKCNDKGDRVCLRDWYGPNCSKFCNNSNKQFKCNVDGDKICLKNWFGKDCSKLCNNSNTHYKCSDKGDMVCLRDWYGLNCSKFCNNTDERFKCKVDGGKTCMQNWYGENCTILCNNTALLEGEVVKYHCDKNGNKTCADKRYGPECDLRYTPIIPEPSEINSGRQQSETGLYYCEIEEGMKGKNVSCPEGWKDTHCLKDCENIKEDVEKYKRKCNKSNGRALLCSNNTAKNDECSSVLPYRATPPNSDSRHDVSNVKLYGGLFGTFFLMLIITTIVVVYVSLKKKKQATTTSPLYENPQAMTDENFTRNFNRAELTLTIDELMRRQSNADELGYDNEGMMVENPLYDSLKSMRAVTPFKPISSTAASPDEVFAMSNTAV